MQPDRFTVKSQEAVAAAQALAAERKNPQVTSPHLLVALVRQEDGLVVPILRSSAPTRRDRRPGGGSGRGAAEVERDRRGASLLRAGRDSATGREGDGRDGRRVHLHRAPPARPDRVGLRRRRPAARPRLAGEGRGRSARTAQGHLAQPRGQRPGAGEIRPRPDRRGGGGEARPGDRPRRGDPPRDPGPLPPHQEQPGADRRPRGRQDRDRRGPGAADRRRRRAREPARPPRDRARHRLAAGGIQIPRRVRGAAESGADRGSGRRGPDRPLPRRAAHDRRRRRRGRRGRRRQPVEADAGARRSCARSGRRRSTSTASTSRKTRHWSGASSLCWSASPTSTTRSRSCAG